MIEANIALVHVGQFFLYQDMLLRPLVNLVFLFCEIGCGSYLSLKFQVLAKILDFALCAANQLGLQPTIAFILMKSSSYTLMNGRNSLCIGCCAGIWKLFPQSSRNLDLVALLGFHTCI